MPKIHADAPEKKLALAKLKKRLAENKTKRRINNSSLPAGYPMYYYCQICGEEMILPECHSDPAPLLCYECKNLKENGWIVYPPAAVAAGRK